MANRLLKETDMVLVSIDAIFTAHGFDWDTNTLPEKAEWQRIFDTSYTETRDALTAGKNVLYDSTNQTRASRDTLRAVAQSVHAQARVMYLHTSEETVWKRWEENKKNPRRSIVQRDLVRMTIDTFEAPTEDEEVIVVENF